MLARRLAVPVPGQEAHRAVTERASGAWRRTQPGGGEADRPGLVPAHLLRSRRREATATRGRLAAAACRDPRARTPGGGAGGRQGSHLVLCPFRLPRQRFVGTAR